MTREKVIRFGGGASLVGVLAEPPPAARLPDAPGVILANSGVLHRVGACRLHVALARQLAARGLVTLRFDFSGIGDSGVRHDDLPVQQSGVVELREAMDRLASRGVSGFLLMGLCSGADMAFETACVDRRVRGLALLDPWAYRTPGYFLRRYAPRLVSPRAWARFARRRLRRRRVASRDSAAPDLDLPTYVREFPARERVARELGGLVERDVRLLCIFSGGFSEHYNHEGQFAAAFPGVDLRDRLREIYIPEATHIFTGLAHQRQVLEAIGDWVEQRLPIANAAPVEAAA